MMQTIMVNLAHTSESCNPGNNRMVLNRVRRIKAFTLIEVLVVIAIIAVLAVILFPVITNAKRAAKKPVCTENLKQIGEACEMYLQDHDGAMASGTAGGADELPGYKSEPTYMGNLAAYVKTKKVFDCPLDNGYLMNGTGYDPTANKGASPSEFTEYGTSYFYQFEGATVPLIQSVEVKSPSTMWEFRDNSGAWHTGAPMIPFNASRDEFFSIRNSYAYNVLFFDNHVKYLTQSAYDDNLSGVPSL